MAKVSNLTGEDVKDAAPANKNNKPAEGAKATPFNFEAACEYAALIEEQQGFIDEINEEYKAKRAPYADKIGDLYDAAAEKGVTKKVLKFVLSDRHRQRKKQASLSKLSDDHRSQVQQLELDLRDQDFEAGKQEDAA